MIFNPEQRNRFAFELPPGVWKAQGENFIILRTAEGACLFSDLSFAKPLDGYSTIGWSYIKLDSIDEIPYPETLKGDMTT